MSQAITIRGVIQPPGAGGGGTGSSWNLYFGLLAWREARDGGELQERKLRLAREVSEEELDAYMEMLQPFSVVELSVRLDEEVLEEVIAVDVEDEVLGPVAERLQAPIEREHTTFGTFVYDHGASWFEASTTWVGQDVRLHLATEEATDFDAMIGYAEALWGDAAGWDLRVRSFVVDELLPTYNASWNDAAPLAADDFLGRIHLESVGVFAGGSFELWFDDGGLFEGHSIVVSGSLDEGLEEASLAG